MRIVIRSQAVREAREAQSLLAAAGIEAVAVAAGRDAPDGVDVLILPAIEESVDDARVAARTARASVSPPMTVILAVAWKNATAKRLEGDPDFDGAIALDAPPSLLAQQVEALVRVAIAAEEAHRRARTATALDVPTPLPNAARPLKALYIGAPSPMFLKLENVFAQHGGVVAAAFSSFAGFDHLHDDTFDAVVLNGAQDAKTAVSLCAALRRNATLYYLPTMVLVAPNDTETAKVAIERGASAVATLNAPSGASLGWLFAAIRRERRRQAAEHDLRALRDLLGDPRTGLLKRPAFEAHLQRLAEDHHGSGRPMSLAVLRVLPAHGAREPTPQVWRRGFGEIASLAGRLLREADSGATIGGNLIAVALPATDHMGARRSAERIASVSECTAFAAGDNGAVPLVFEQSAVELQPGESGAGLLARALRAFETESVTA